MLSLPRILFGLCCAVLGCTGGCSGGSAAAPQGQGVAAAARDTSEVAEPGTALAGASGRCQGGACACRPIDELGRGLAADTDAEASPPPEGTKRFELRTGRGDDTMKITVEGLGTFVKQGPDPEPGCIYVDLPPGAHRVRYHILAADPAKGLEARLRISEYSPTFRRWYRTFAYRCGSGTGPCTRDDARDALQALQQVPGGKYDPCGSTKVQGLRFHTERAADVALGDFNLQLVLDVYKFAPRFPPGAPDCKGPGGRQEPAGEQP